MPAVSFLTYHDLHAKMTESSADIMGPVIVPRHTITPHNSFMIYGIYLSFARCLYRRHIWTIMATFKFFGIACLLISNRELRN